MSPSISAEAQQTFLVEHYRPGLGVEALTQCAARVRQAAIVLEGEGRPVQCLRSTVIPRDESIVSVFAAASEEIVREACARAGFPFDRISAGISVEVQ